MNGAAESQLDIGPFTFGSLYFCGIDVRMFRGPQLMTTINDFYMPFIRTGWTVPLSFVMDISAMLVSGAAGYSSEWKKPGVPQALVDLSVDYYHMLRQMRSNRVFQHVRQRVAQTDANCRNGVIRTFLRFLLSEMSELNEIVSFKSRQMVVHDMHPTPGRISHISMTTASGRKDNLEFKLHSAEKLHTEPVIAILAQLVRRITDYYTNHPLEDFISDEELFMIDYAAWARESADRLDYHLLNRMLDGADGEEPEVSPPLSFLVEEILPTENYQQDGVVGGYIDINRKPISDAVSEILPSEFATIDYPEVFFDKMLNEGVLHYIREDIERIEQELRVLFYYVVDTQYPMLRATSQADRALAPGLTPWTRGKALVADTIRDLARFFPRKNVRADVVIYLWAPDASPGLRCVFDLFKFDPDRSQSRLSFASDMAEVLPQYFYHQLYKTDQPEFVHLEKDPYRNLEHMSDQHNYHCRHLMLVTSSHTGVKFMPTRDMGLMAGDFGRDSIWAVLSDVTRPTMGLSRPLRVSETGLLGSEQRMTELQLRNHFLESAIMKAAARRPQRVVADIGENSNE